MIDGFINPKDTGGLLKSWKRNTLLGKIENSIKNEFLDGTDYNFIGEDKRN